MLAGIQSQSLNEKNEFIFSVTFRRYGPGPAYQQTSQCLNKWNVFRNRSLQFVRLILIVCYQKLRNFGILQNLLMIPF